MSTKRTRKPEFLDEMRRVVRWAELIALIEPNYRRGKTGRPLMEIATMLRIHFLQQWFGLSNQAMEDALHDVPLYREFADPQGPMRRVPDESALLRFRALLEAHGLAAPRLATVNRALHEHGLTLKTSTVVGATLIAAPSSTRNSNRGRYPEIRQPTKGNNYYFGLKAHIGGVGYQDAHNRTEATMKNWHAAMRPGKRRKLDVTNPREAIANEIERLKESVRAKVAHPVPVIKRETELTKVRYSGPAKNTPPLATPSHLSNLSMARR